MRERVEEFGSHIWHRQGLLWGYKLSGPKSGGGQVCGEEKGSLPVSRNRWLGLPYKQLALQLILKYSSSAALAGQAEATWVFFVRVVLEIKPRALSTLGKHATC